MTTVHKNLTGADLHEPKGADAAIAGQVYVSNGSGSGVWTTASSIITNTAFTTGDLKITHKLTADASWVLWSESTIGDGSSSASIRANADTSALFALYWTNFSNTLCPVSGGRGASAAADFAAHKTLQLPPGPGRALLVAGAGAGLTSRAFGVPFGAETYTMLRSDLVNQALSISGTVTSTSTPTNVATGSPQTVTPGGVGSAFQAFQPTTLATGAITSTGSGTTLTTSSINGGVSQTALPLVQPSTAVNIMIKL